MERKKKEMEKKQEELKKIKKKKKKEIMDKIAELKQITGNSSLGIQDLDLDQEFDSKQHDEMMKKMFNEDYYNEKDTEKPVFSDGNMDGIYDDDFGGQAEHENNDEMPEYNYDDQEVLDIEDPNFNMDADYDPTQYQRKKKGRNRKRKSKKEKPAFFNGDEMTFDEYFDEYYKLDYEDLIEDQPCRYQYRSVVPNDFGLTTEEILKSDDKDLNVWCPLRKLVQYRTDQEEFTDEMIYYKRGKNMDRKKRFLSSFYNKMEKSENGANYEDEHESNSHQNSNQKKGTLKKKQEEENKKKVVVNDSIDMLKESGTKNGLQRKREKKKKPQEKDKKVKKPEEERETQGDEKTYETLLGNHKTKKEKKKKQQEEKEETKEIKNEKMNVTLSENQNSEKQNKRKRKREEHEVENEAILECLPKNKNSLKGSKSEEDKKAKKKQKTKNETNNQVPKAASVNSFMSKTRLKKKERAKKWRMKNDDNTKHNMDLNISLSNERLKAYGLNPKKFKYLKVAENKI